MIEGARRVGKSTVVEEFGRREYKSVAVIDFMKPNRKVVSAKGRRLFFYSRYDLDNAENRMEIDFLVRHGDKICPVEVKSGKYSFHSSLDKFRRKFGSRIDEPIILYTKDVMEKDGITYLPLYMAPLL